VRPNWPRKRRRLPPQPPSVQSVRTACRRHVRAESGCGPCPLQDVQRASRSQSTPAAPAPRRNDVALGSRRAIVGASLARSVPVTACCATAARPARRPRTNARPRPLQCPAAVFDLSAFCAAIISFAARRLIRVELAAAGVLLLLSFYFYFYSPHSISFLSLYLSTFFIFFSISLPPFNPGLVLDLVHLTLGVRDQEPNQESRASGAPAAAGLAIRAVGRAQIRNRRRSTQRTDAERAQLVRGHRSPADQAIQPSGPSLSARRLSRATAYSARGMADAPPQKSCPSAKPRAK
jgi:hypothetical protein